MTIARDKRDAKRDAKRLLKAFEALKEGWDDEPFWQIRAEIWAKLPVEMRDELDRAFVAHLQKILDDLGVGSDD
jgi:hypothetical protein